MKQDEILRFYDYLSYLALSKCENREDAEDLVSDTMLAAFSFLDKGGIIEYPKTWLANTLMHKYNSALRKKYRKPVIVSLDSVNDVAGAGNIDSDFLKTEKAALLRREVNFLAYTTREVLIRYYFGRNSIKEISHQLNIPEGTVKRRLSTGRTSIKKGFEQMENKEQYLPGKLYLSWSGSNGPNNEPLSLVEENLIAQNILILAYDKPLYMADISRMIGIPSAYLEPIVKKLVEGELMIQTGIDKYYTDFIIYKPEDFLMRFETQLNFVDNHFEIFWNAMSYIIKNLDSAYYTKTLNKRQRKKLERYAIMRTLQNFQLRGIGDDNINSYPNRRDGGNWIALGNMIPSGYDENKHKKTNEYLVWGGHRTTSGRCDFSDSENLCLYEFDTSLWDSPRRFMACGVETYFKEIVNLLWCVYKNIPIEKSGVSNNMILSIPKLEELGLITTENGKYEVDIPVMERETYDKITEIIDSAYDYLITEIGTDYKKYLVGNKIAAPSHIKSITEIFKYSPATNYIVMAVVRKAYEKNLHLHDVDYCCPPAVLVGSLSKPTIEKVP